MTPFTLIIENLCGLTLRDVCILDLSENTNVAGIRCVTVKLPDTPIKTDFYTLRPFVAGYRITCTTANYGNIVEQLKAGYFLIEATTFCFSKNRIPSELDFYVGINTKWKIYNHRAMLNTNKRLVYDKSISSQGGERSFSGFYRLCKNHVMIIGSLPAVSSFNITFYPIEVKMPATY